MSIGSSVENKMCFNIYNQRICYFQPDERKKNGWENARNICYENRATLPLIENQEAQNMFEQYLRSVNLNNNDVWLGGRQEVTKREWQWTNKKPFSQPGK